MQTENFGDIKAVVFDIDGTLYKDWHLFRRMFFHFLRHCIFFLKYGLVRKELRKNGEAIDFYEVQAEKMAKLLHCSSQKAKDELDKIVYSGLKKYFTNIKTCDFAVETIQEFKNAGIKIALLSDFPPEQKGELWGLKPYCDVVLSTEECGALKPSAVPFLDTAEKLGINPNEVLYVGNSFKVDIRGAENAGMKSAWFVSRKKYRKQKNNETADLVFCDYRTLKDAVLCKNKN